MGNNLAFHWWKYSSKSDVIAYLERHKLLPIQLLKLIFYEGCVYLEKTMANLPTVKDLQYQ